jgi:hypothetical protein
MMIRLSLHPALWPSLKLRFEAEIAGPKATPQHVVCRWSEDHGCLFGDPGCHRLGHCLCRYRLAFEGDSQSRRRGVWC